MSAYYNEHDPFAAAWLRELIKQGLIADGEVDERSIALVQPDDVRGFAQCHFFAGIGGWSYALRLAGWPDGRAVWTGSCPCQPFSAAGAQAGGHDPRDLWPVWNHLIAQCRPAVVFGEQVEAAIGHGWLDRVCDDLEAEGYAVGACGVPAGGVGAFHIRQRLWFVAHAAGGRGYDGRGAGEECAARGDGDSASERGGAFEEPSGLRVAGGVAHTECGTTERYGQSVAGAAGAPEGAAQERERLRADVGDGGATSDVAQSERGGCGGRGDADDGGARALQAAGPSAAGDMGHAELYGSLAIRQPRQPEAERRLCQPEGSSFWAGAEWLPCSDGKARPVEPGTFPLAYGVSARVGRLRGYGNAIVPQVAAAFIRAYLER